MKIYDKVAWHIDGGEELKDVLRRFMLLFGFLESNNLLNEDGKEIYGLGIDESVSLHDGLLTAEGVGFLDTYYEKISRLSTEELYRCCDANS